MLQLEQQLLHEREAANEEVKVAKLYMVELQRELQKTQVRYNIENCTVVCNTILY